MCQCQSFRFGMRMARKIVFACRISQHLFNGGSPNNSMWAFSNSAFLQHRHVHMCGHINQCCCKFRFILKWKHVTWTPAFFVSACIRLKSCVAYRIAQHFLNGGSLAIPYTATFQSYIPATSTSAYMWVRKIHVGATTCRRCQFLKFDTTKFRRRSFHNVNIKWKFMLLFSICNHATGYRFTSSSLQAFMNMHGPKHPPFVLLQTIWITTKIIFYFSMMRS